MDHAAFGGKSTAGLTKPRRAGHCTARRVGGQRALSEKSLVFSFGGGFFFRRAARPGFLSHGNFGAGRGSGRASQKETSGRTKKTGRGTTIRSRPGNEQSSQGCQPVKAGPQSCCEIGPAPS